MLVICLLQVVTDLQAQVKDSIWAFRVIDSVHTLGRKAQINEAEAYLDPYLKEFRDNEIWWAYAHGISLKAGFKRVKGNFEVAYQLLDSSLSIGKKHLPSGHSTMGLVHNNMGIYHAVITKDYPQAAFYFQNALDIQIALTGETNARVAQYYTNLGNIAQNMGDDEGAFTMKFKALSINKQIFPPDHPTMASFYNNLGHVYLRMGDFREALRMFRQAFALRIKAPDFGPDHPLIGLYALNLSETFNFLGMQDSAEHYVQMNLRITLKNNDNNRLGGTYHLISSIASQKGELAKALKYNQKAIDTYSKIFGETNSDVLHMMDSRRKILEDADKLPEALKAAYIINDFQYTTLKNHYLFFNYWRLISRLHFKMGQMKMALKTIQYALVRQYPEMDSTDFLALPDSITKPYNRPVNTLQLKARILFYSDSLDLPREEVLKSIVAHNKLADKYLKKHLTIYKWADSRENLLAVLIPMYETAIMACKELAERTGDPKWNAEAHFFAEAFRANSLRNSLTELRAKAFADLPAEVLKKEKKLRVEADFYEGKLRDIRSGSQRKNKNYQAWEGKLFSLQSSLDSLHREMENKYPNYFQLKFSDPFPTLNEVQKTLEKDVALIQYFWGDSSLYVFKVTSDKVILRKVSSNPANLENQINEFIAEMKAAGVEESSGSLAPSFAQKANSIYDMLVGPELTPDISQVVFIPDGILGHLPFDILVSNLPTNPSEATWGSLDYLFKTKVIRYGFASKLSKHLGKSNAPVSVQVAAFAPKFENDLLAENTTIRRGRGDIPFGNLTQNQTEAFEIGQIISGKVFAATEATEENFKQYANRYQILHLASHAFVDDKNPRFSGLVFTLPEAGEGSHPDTTGTLPEDGILSVDEIFNLSLNADLTVLSACNTGIGKYVRGEGLMSLARAFRYAGCPNIATSLWEANDFSTRKIMTAFYRNLKDGKGKAEALQLAKLEYLSENDKSPPFYWAGFIMIGDNEPVDRDRFPKWITWSDMLVSSIILGTSLILISILIFIGPRLWSKQ